MTNTLIFFKKESHLKNIFILKIGLCSAVDFFPPSSDQIYFDLGKKYHFDGMKCKIEVFFKTSQYRPLKNY